MVDDIVKLWGMKLGFYVIGVLEYCYINVIKYFIDVFWRNRILFCIFDGKKFCYFNIGVMVMDMMKWRMENYCVVIE